VRAFLDAADDLLAAQQQLMPDPLPADLRALAEAYTAARTPLLYARAATCAAFSGPNRTSHAKRAR
jgi:hypothetical protein